MFGVIEIKIENIEDSSDDDRTLIQYATRVKQEPSPLTTQPDAPFATTHQIKEEPEDYKPFAQPDAAFTTTHQIKEEPEDCKPFVSDFLAAELADYENREGYEATDDYRSSDGSEPDDGSEQERTAECDMCGGFYRNKQGLNAHKRRIHFNKYLKKARRTGECSVCHKKYVNRKSLQTHMNKMHLKDNGQGHQFKCEDCGKVFRIRNSLWMHRYYKHSGRDLRTACEYCPRVLKSPRSHKDHMKKKHPCEFLSRTDATPMGEAEAIVKVRPHKCELCQKRYTSMTTLRKHAAMVHSAPEDARDCPMCERQFKTEARLLSHLGAAHSGVADLRKCTTCGLISKNKYSLQHHMHYTHGVRAPLDAGASCTPEEARRYTRRPNRAPLHDPLMPPTSPAPDQPEFILP